MLEIFTQTIFLLFLSFMSGFFTKTADLLDEHGLRWFKGADILFGILWGASIAILLVENHLLGSFYLGLILNWIVRKKIDYLNHKLATGIIFISFIFVIHSYSFDWLLFAVSFILFTSIGLLLDYNKIKRSIITKYNMFMCVILLILVFLKIEYWIVFASYTLNNISYHLTKYYGTK